MTVLGNGMGSTKNSVVWLHLRWLSLVATSLVTSTKLLAVEPG